MLVGHELVHHKYWLHKVLGNIPYTQIFYSHFWEEHTQGHHKYVATPEDPVWHDIGTSVYFAVPKAAIGTHITTWKRNTDRLKKLNDGKYPSILM